MVAIILYYYVYLIIYIERIRASRRKGRYRTRAKDAAAIFARSSPLFRSVCCLHRPHHRQRSPSPRRTLNKRKGRAATSAPIDQQPAATGQRLDGLPSCPPRPRPLLQVVRAGQRASQVGRFPPAHPVAPSPPYRSASAYMRTPQDGEGCAKPSQGGEARPCDSKFREFLRGCIALNINYLISPLGYAVQSLCRGETIIIPKV